MSVSQLLSNVHVTGSNVIYNANLSGIGGTLVIQSGDYVLVSGAGSSTAINSSDIVYTSGTQFISGTKYFIGNTFIDNLFVTGTQTVINTQDLYVGDNWIVINATGAARDSAIFVATGFTGASATGGVIGFDVPSNTWRFGLASQLTDLFTLPRIASGEAVDALDLRLIQTGANLYSLLINESGALITQIALTGQTAWTHGQNNALNLSGNLGTTGSNLYNLITAQSGVAEGIYVHRTGAESITGAKTLVDTTQFLANLRFTNVRQSTSFTFAAGTYRYIWSGAANCTGTLPAPSATSGIEFMVKNLSPTGSLVISGLIDYSQNYALTPMQGVTLWSDNTSWLLV